MAHLDPKGGGSSGVLTEEFSFGFEFNENMVSRVVMFLEKFKVAEIKVR